MNVHVAHTADLDTATRTAVRALLDEAFDGDFGDEDWAHTLGGMHAIVWQDGELVGHAAVVQRQFPHGGRTMRTGYVEGVTRTKEDDDGIFVLPVAEVTITADLTCDWRDGDVW